MWQPQGRYILPRTTTNSQLLVKQISKGRNKLCWVPGGNNGRLEEDGLEFYNGIHPENMTISFRPAVYLRMWRITIAVMIMAKICTKAVAVRVDFGQMQWDRRSEQHTWLEQKFARDVDISTIAFGLNALVCAYYKMADDKCGRLADGGE